MNNKKVLMRLISLLIILCVLPIVSCSQKGKEKRVVKALSAGSSVWMVGDANKTYEIKALGEKTETGVFYFTDYYVSESGTSYEILDNRGKAVSTIKLAKKSETYNPQVYEFNLDAYTEHGITITADMDYVKIFSSDPSIAHDLVIIIDFERTKPCDIEFTNVNIQTTETCSVLYNYSQYDLNLKFEGENYFKVGKTTGFEEYYEALNAYEKADAAYAVSVNALAFVGYYFYGKAAEAHVNTIKDVVNEWKQKVGTTEAWDLDISTEHFVSATEDMLQVISSGLDGVETLIRNQNGADGIDGATAFMSFGSLYLYGSGDVTIIGGDGIDGIDAHKGLIDANNTKGGNGGDGGSAIVANIFIENISGTFQVQSGTPGQGGNGAGYTPIKGRTGTTPKEILSSFSYPDLD